MTGSHAALLTPIGRATHGPALDAVLVPAARSVRHLSTAAGLATQLGCALVVLCSRDARSSDVGTLAAHWPGLRWTAVDLPAGYGHDLLGFETSAADYARVGRLGDLSLKRNLGLLLARLAGWRTMMFLDDDLEDVVPGQVRAAAAALDRLAVTGLRIGEFPDNSVVCHANRLAGGAQDVFVTGSALLVDCERPLPFFPETYNEDWLFYVDALAARSVGMTGSARQLRYQPFTTERAESEEFGDVLAEGLVDLLHEGSGLAAARGPAPWRRFLARRRAFIERIADELDRRPEVAGRSDALLALKAAELRCGGLTADQFTDYVRCWRSDLGRWHGRLAQVRSVGGVGPALRWLGLEHCAVMADGVHSGPVRARKATQVSFAVSRVVAVPAVEPQVDPAAEVARTARIGVPYRPLQEGEWERLGRPTVIGAGCRIGEFCVVGDEAVLGPGCILDAHTIVAAGATLGARVLLTHRATVDPKAVVGDDCVIGGLVAERSRIGNHCRVFGDLVHRQLDPTSPWDADDSTEGSPILGDGAFVGWGATVIGSVTIGAGAYVCAGAVVTRDVPAGHIASGVNTIRPPSAWNGALAKSEFFRSAAEGPVDQPVRRAGVLRRFGQVALLGLVQPRRFG